MLNMGKESKVDKPTGKRRLTALTARQEMFVREYLVDLNATQAAIRAGYSPRSAEVTGHHLLKNHKVRAAIQTAMEERSQRTEITADRVLKEVARIAFFDVRRLYDKHGRLKPPKDWDADCGAAVAGMRVLRTLESGDEVLGVTLVSKDSALEKLCKHLGLYERDNKQRRPTVVLRDLTGADGDD